MNWNFLLGIELTGAVSLSTTEPILSNLETAHNIG